MVTKLDISERRPILSRAEQAHRWVDMILAMRAATRPELTENSEHEKDRKAQEVLYMAGQLTQLIAGWAIDHNFGAAVRGAQGLPSVEPGMDAVDGYPEALALWDDHCHEQYGRSLAEDRDLKLSASQERNALLSLLRSDSTALPSRLAELLIKGLAEVEHGREAAVFSPEPKGRKIDTSVEKAMLSALCHVEYRKAQGMKAGAAQRHVAAAYCVSHRTVPTWKGRVKRKLGAVLVDLELARAKHAATDAHIQDTVADIHFGERALARCAGIYRRLNARKPG